MNYKLCIIIIYSIALHASEIPNFNIQNYLSNNRGNSSSVLMSANNHQNVLNNQSSNSTSSLNSVLRSATFCETEIGQNRSTNSLNGNLRKEGENNGSTNSLNGNLKKGGENNDSTNSLNGNLKKERKVSFSEDIEGNKNENQETSLEGSQLPDSIEATLSLILAPKTNSNNELVSSNSNARALSSGPMQKESVLKIEQYAAPLKKKMNELNKELCMFQKNYEKVLQEIAQQQEKFDELIRQAKLLKKIKQDSPLFGLILKIGLMSPWLKVTNNRNNSSSNLSFVETPNNMKLEQEMNELNEKLCMFQEFHEEVLQEIAKQQEKFDELIRKAEKEEDSSLYWLILEVGLMSPWLKVTNNRNNSSSNLSFVETPSKFFNSENNMKSDQALSLGTGRSQQEQVNNKKNIFELERPFVDQTFNSKKNHRFESDDDSDDDGVIDDQ